MKCPRCGSRLISDDRCVCGEGFFTNPIYTVSPLSTSQKESLTELYLRVYGDGIKKLEPPLSVITPGKKYGMWGPKRPMYTMDQPARFAVFNSICDNSAVGDERNFVRIVEKGVGGTYCSNLVVEPNKQYAIYIYLHNNASITFNDKAHNHVGVARNTRLSCSFPDFLAKGEEGLIYSTITASNTDLKAVWAGAYITATEDMTLHYVAGSAKIYNAWQTNGRILSTNLFSRMGTFLGMNELNGVYPGCDKFSGSVRYTIQTRQKIVKDTLQAIAARKPESLHAEDKES